MRFSTKDRDNDANNGDCVQNTRSAGWHASCARLTFFGLYGNAGDAGSRFFHWSDWKTSNALKAIDISIKRAG